MQGAAICDGCGKVRPKLNCLVEIRHRALGIMLEQIGERAIVVSLMQVRAQPDRQIVVFNSKFKLVGLGIDVAEISQNACIVRGKLMGLP